MSDGSNLSDHSPIFVTLKYDSYVDQTFDNNNNNQNINSQPVEKRSFFDWSHTTAENISNYKFTLDYFLDSIDFADDLLECRNLFCEMHTDSIIDYFEAIVLAMISATCMSIPEVIIDNNGNYNIIPGWNLYVRESKEKSIYWHNIWKLADRPIQGQLANIRKHTREKYHQAIKFAKRNKDKFIQNKVADSLKFKNFSEFWKEVNKLKPIKKQTNSKIVDDEFGDGNISNLFKSKYDNIYNEFETSYDHIIHMNEGIRYKCVNNLCNIDHEISVDLVKECIKKLKKDKNDPNHEISSNNIIYGTDKLAFHLTNIFNLFITHGVTNDSLNESVFIPIPKNKRKSLCDSSNYRAIALCSIIGKLFEYVLLSKLNSMTVSNEYQLGFKDNVSTTYCSFLINQTIQYYLNNDSNVLCLFLDASKAFDRVRHDKLFPYLIGRNICPLILRIIAIMYAQNSARVRWNSSISESFYMTCGVKQGGILSPFLFNLYLETLINSITNSKIGCHVGNKPANIFSYADDIVILAPTVNSLKQLIRIIDIFKEDFSINFNPDKSFILFYSNSDFNGYFNIFLDNVKIQVMSQGKHLGFNMVNNREIYEIKSFINDIYVRSNVIKNNFKQLDSQVKKELFNSHCLSLYGCELWDLQSKHIIELEIAWRKYIRCILKLPHRTRCALPLDT